MVVQTCQEGSASRLEASEGLAAGNCLSEDQRMRVKFGISWLSQERIVFVLAALLFVIASISLNGFFTPDNLVAIVRSVSVLGILAVGMAIVVIGRGIDLSAVAIMAMSVAWYLELLNTGTAGPTALALSLGFVLLIGLVNGFLIAYADVPAIFATLASGAFVFGFVRSQLIRQDATPVPAGNWIETLGRVRLLDVPVEVFLFTAIAIVAALFLRFTKWGRFVYLMGDNPLAARNMGIAVRPVTVLRYVISALIAFVAGILTASSLLSINTRVVNSSLLYDILNAMIILDIPNIYQNLIKSTILLLAIVIDSFINPRDEQTAQQGDI
jgi:ribose transport system permease protein